MIESIESYKSIVCKSHAGRRYFFEEVAGKVLGDAKLESEGKADQVEVQNAVGGVKDTLRGE